MRVRCPDPMQLPVCFTCACSRLRVLANGISSRLFLLSPETADELALFFEKIKQPNIPNDRTLLLALSTVHTLRLQMCGMSGESSHPYPSGPEHTGASVCVEISFCVRTHGKWDQRSIVQSLITTYHTRCRPWRSSTCGRNKEGDISFSRLSGPELQ